MSPGPHRRLSSPRGSTPYDQNSPLRRRLVYDHAGHGTGTPPLSSHRSSHSQSSSMSSVADFDFNSQYPQYTGPQAIQAINSFPSHASQPLQRSFAGNQCETGSHAGHLSTTVNIDRIANESKMSTEQRRSVHEFAQMSSSDRHTHLFLRVVQTENRLETIIANQVSMQTTLACLLSLASQGWKPSDAQDKLLKGLLRHYHIKPNGTYTAVVSTVQNYILDHAEDLHLVVYKTDPIVKKVIDKCLADYYNNLKSSFRKLVFTGVTKKVALKKFCRMIVDKHHLPIIPDLVPQPILAAMALMREVASPLVVVANQKGADTGFWPNLEDELDALYKKNGSDRKSPAWLEWEKNIIQDDNTKYDRASRSRDTATSREELDLAAGLGAAPSNGDAGGGLTGDVDIDDLGNIAATTD
ncbi:hypothetical protein B0H10DRAFT_2232577 [Mycena sp. CBHHK59/15]|nr:hypothetical protein B0H10DRAFT_2246011 [Mycena sp. CBHHK59/15]KAJ6596108.1 hypothetical protein B0H10DRAFT_2232577 [Mycena sp. CBHHK59/15]